MQALSPHPQRATARNERGAFYHLLGDAGGSVAVVVSVVAVEVTGVSVIDPLVAVLVAGVVLWSAGKVLRGSSAVFFLKTPLDPGDVREDVEAVEAVERVDDWHVWQICSRITVATAHVETMAAAAAVNRRIHRVLEDHGVDHATIELYPARTDHHARLAAHAH